jgi:formate-dependent nitrite reductase membrane component NrfD
MNTEPRAVRSRVGLPVLGPDAPLDAGRPSEPSSYYDIPFLKQPTWDWRIATYFFLESVSAGASLMASLADLASGGRHPNVRRAGRYVAVAAFVPCAPLLISDLGRPERFHHMLRIFKRTSPMSHGSWTLAAYGLPLTALAALEALGSARVAANAARAAALVPARAIEIVGVPCAMMLAAYPGVLLSTTSNPLWSQSRLLGALFACGSLHAGASAVSLALRESHTDERARLERIAAIASAAEAAVLAAFLRATGEYARPLTAGRFRRLFVFGAVGAGIVLPAFLKAVAPKRGRVGRIARIAATALSLAGTFALKYAITQGGHDAAADPRAGRRALAKRD